MALNKFLPAATDTPSVKLDLAKLAAGEIKLFSGIQNPLKAGAQSASPMRTPSRIVRAC